MTIAYQTRRNVVSGATVILKGNGRYSASIDALLLYTDGLVEGPDRDFDVGIDKLMGEAERLVARGFTHGARTLVDRVPSSDADDRALVLLWRS
jgi:Stage II sporulation protein E (SpoIIE)